MLIISLHLQLKSSFQLGNAMYSEEELLFILLYFLISNSVDGLLHIFFFGRESNVQ